jgi:hypothetical protein
MDTEYLGYVTDTEGNSYLLKHDGYQLVKLPIDKIDPKQSRILLMGSLFNTVIRINGLHGTYWYAIDKTPDLKLLGSFYYEYPTNMAAQIGDYIFPYELTYTSNNDCLAYPRIDFISWKAIFLNAILAILIMIVGRKQRRRCTIGASILTLIFGLYSFIPYILLKK